MNTTFMNSENSKTSEPQKLLFNLQKKLEKSYKSNKFKISDPTQNERYKLPDGSYSASDFQDYFEYIIKNVKQ